MKMIYYIIKYNLFKVITICIALISYMIANYLVQKDDIYLHKYVSIVEENVDNTIYVIKYNHSDLNYKVSKFYHEKIEKIDLDKSIIHYREYTYTYIIFMTLFWISIIVFLFSFMDNENGFFKKREIIYHYYLDKVKYIYEGSSGWVVLNNKILYYTDKLNDNEVIDIYLRDKVFDYIYKRGTLRDFNGTPIEIRNRNIDKI